MPLRLPNLPPGLCICRDPSCTVPYGECHCHCHGKTKIYTQGHSALGHIKGMPRKFIKGHSGVCKYPDRPRSYGAIDGLEVALIPLTQNITAIIDKEDEHKVPGVWCALNGYAVQRNPDGGQKRMHLLILGINDGREPDHENGNRYDNRKRNLRPATHAENMQNQGIRKDNKSGYPGVRYREDRKKWDSRLKEHGHLHLLGLFSLKEDAIKARLEAEQKYFGKFRRRK